MGVPCSGRHVNAIDPDTLLHESRVLSLVVQAAKPIVVWRSLFVVSLLLFVSSCARQDHAPHTVSLADLLAAANAAPAAAAVDMLMGIDAGLNGRQVEVDDAVRRQLNALMQRPTSDVRFHTVLVGVQLSQADCIALAKQLLVDDSTNGDDKAELLIALCARRVTGLVDIALPFLDDEALRSVAIGGLADVEDARVNDRLLSGVAQWETADRTAALSVLASRIDGANQLCSALEQERIDRAWVSPVIARQMLALQDQQLTERVVQVWGNLHSSPAELVEKIQRFQNLLVQEVLDRADVAHGERLANRLCLTCHRLYGQGESIGPDITGSQRQDLYYLLHNIIDPNAEIAKSMQVTIVQMEDGRTLTGIVTEEADQTLTMRTLTNSVTLNKRQIENRRSSGVSMMPEGLLDFLPDDHVRDLLGFLMQDQGQP